LSRKKRQKWLVVLTFRAIQAKSTLKWKKTQESLTSKWNICTTMTNTKVFVLIFKWNN
jgi:hypothetical protein